MDVRQHRDLNNGVAIMATRLRHCEQLEVLQETVFPTLADEELFSAENYAKHIELFPDGQFVAVATGEGEVGPDGEELVVGMTSTLRMGDDCLDPLHRFADVIKGGWLARHDPRGRWMYGVDIGAHPDWRGLGIARALYAARHEACRRLGLAGQVAVGMLNGYHLYSDNMSAVEYLARVVEGRIKDPTITAQQKIGFQPRGLIDEYVDDPSCDGYGVLMVLPADVDVPWPS